jgi:hypothetical protein
MFGGIVVLRLSGIHPVASSQDQDEVNRGSIRGCTEGAKQADVKLTRVNGY